VNATQEMISRSRSRDLGPVQFRVRRSATTPIMAARQDAGHPSLRVETLIDTTKISQRVPHGAVERQWDDASAQLLSQYSQG